MQFSLTALDKSPFMKLEIEIFFVALLARSGKSKISFWQFLGFSVDFFVGLHKNKNSCRKKLVGVYQAQLFLKIIGWSRISKKINFLVGEHWALFQKGLTLCTKYIETFRKAQVISKCVNKWARAPEYAGKDF